MVTLFFFQLPNYKARNNKMPKYSTIRISPTGHGKKRRWEYTIERDQYDRVTQPLRPHPLGFFHYHGISDEEAFIKLRESILARHKEEIKNLMESIKKLEELKFIDEA